LKLNNYNLQHLIINQRTIIIFKALLLSTLLLCTLPALADFAKGWDAYQNKDYATAFKELKPLVDQGCAYGQSRLGRMYEYGKGVFQDFTRAHMGFNIAASQGIEYGQKNRDKAAKLMTILQIAEAQTLARECLAKDYKGC